jgi:hypothetical protein
MLQFNYLSTFTSLEIYLNRTIWTVNPAGTPAANLKDHEI